MTQLVDYAHVPTHQGDIHERLINWARWCRPNHTNAVLPMFRHYRPYLYPERECSTPIDSKDAVEVQKCMAHIPEKQRYAIGWCYVIRSNPARAARDLGVSTQGLMDLINQGRDMVKNRLAMKELA